MSLKDLLPGGARRTPKRGRPGKDVKHVKIPKGTHALLYMYAKDHGMTFGDAATYLIGIGLMHEYDLYDEGKQRPEDQLLQALRKADLPRARKSATP